MHYPSPQELAEERENDKNKAAQWAKNPNHQPEKFGCQQDLAKLLRILQSSSSSTVVAPAEVRINSGSALQQTINQAQREVLEKPKPFDTTNGDVVSAIMTSDRPTGDKVISLFAVTQLHYRQPLGDRAWDAMAVLVGSDMANAVAFIAGLQYGAGASGNMDKKSYEALL